MDAKQQYSEKLQCHFSANDSQSVWQGLRKVTDDKPIASFSTNDLRLVTDIKLYCSFKRQWDRPGNICHTTSSSGLHAPQLQPTPGYDLWTEALHSSPSSQLCNRTNSPWWEYTIPPAGDSPTCCLTRDCTWHWENISLTPWTPVASPATPLSYWGLQMTPPS